MAKKATVIIEDDSEIIKENFFKSFEAANQKSIEIISDFFETGYKEMLARLLFYLPEENRSQALDKLPPELRKNVNDIFLSYGQKKNTDPDVSSTAGYVLKKAGFYGKACAHEILNNDNFKPLTIQELDYFFNINPLLALNTEYYGVSLSILLNLDDRAIQKWLREAEEVDLAIALIGADEEIKNKIFRNMSRRAANLLREDMEFMGPVRRKDIIEKQKKLINLLFRLEDNGDIVIASDHFNTIGDDLVF